MIWVTWGGIRWAWSFSFFAVWGLMFAMSEGVMRWEFGAAILLHEGSHVMAMQWMGQKIRQITFHGCGIRILPVHRCYGYGQDCCVLLAGPMANLATALGLWLLGADEGSLFWQANVSLGVANLLPCRHLDGGAALTCLMNCMGLEQRRSDLIRRMMACSLLIGIMGIGAIYGVRNVSLYAVGCYLLCTEFLG